MDIAVDLRGRHLLTMQEYTAEEIGGLLDLAAHLKQLRRTGIKPRHLAGRNIALVFLKPSCRTRMSFVVAASDEGAHLEIFGAEEIRFGIKESVRDVARVMGRMFDGIVFRGFEHEVVQELAAYAGVPVWNGLCDRYHPTQVLADLLTVRDVFGTLDGQPICYVGDGRNNQARSLAIAAVMLGLDLRILGPPALLPDPAELAALNASAAPGANLLVTDDAKEAMAGAAVVYGDVWVSMGEEDQVAERIELLREFKVTPALLALTGRTDSVYLHCLPAFHDEETSFGRTHPGIQEVDDEVFEGPQSRVFDQAENRMHTAKALMVATVR